MDFEDLIGFKTDKELEKQAITLKDYGIPINPNDEIDKWVVRSYAYAINKGLKDYQARSFASEFTLMKTGSIKETDTNLIYREDWLDSFICDRFKEILKENNDEKDDTFWNNFICFLTGFYMSSKSWHYERTKHQVNVKLSQQEYDMFLSVDADRNIDKFVVLLKSFNKDGNLMFERKGKAEKQLVFKFGESINDCFMNIPMKTKSSRFFLALYQYCEL